MVVPRSAISALWARKPDPCHTNEELFPHMESIQHEQPTDGSVPAPQGARGSVEGCPHG